MDGDEPHGPCHLNGVGCGNHRLDTCRLRGLVGSSPTVSIELASLITATVTGWPPFRLISFFVDKV